VEELEILKIVDQEVLVAAETEILVLVQDKMEELTKAAALARQEMVQVEVMELADLVL
jgi:hypothetical protein